MANNTINISLITIAVLLVVLQSATPNSAASLNKQQNENQVAASQPEAVITNEADALNEAESADSGAAEALRDFDDEEPTFDEPKEVASGSANQMASLDNSNQSQDGNEDDSAEASNIANAKIDVSSQDLATAAGHHHHHGHYPHGMLKMGAHTGKKGSFGWHDKHPVGGKGRR